MTPLSRKDHPQSTAASRPPVNFRMVESDDALAQLAADLAGTELLAIDTEFIGEKTYYPTLELIQVSDGRGLIAVIDMQRIGDAAPFARVVGDPRVEKIFHAGGQDLPILERALGAPPLPAFDTQLAAAMVGMGPQVSLAALTMTMVGAKVDKGQTVTDWSRRPLRPEQLDYAARDVENLHTMREKLVELLEARGRMAWFREEQERRAADALNTDAMPAEEFHRSVKEWAKVSGRSLAVLRELAIWRDDTARASNLPRRFIMPDPALVALAQLCPKSKRDIEHARNIPAGQYNRHESAIQAAIKRGCDLPKDQWPRKDSGPRPDIPTGFVELMQSLVRTVAETEEIAPTLLATSGELNALVNNRNRAEELELPVLAGWRRELIGEKLLALINGELRVRIADRNRLVFE